MTEPAGAAQDSETRLAPRLGAPLRPPASVRLLSGVWGTLGRSPVGRRLLRMVRARTLGRVLTGAAVAMVARGLPENITVLIGVRNRTDHRIVNALRSLRKQVYPRGRVAVLVVDYGSDPEAARGLAGICARHGAEVIRVDDVDVWSRSRCLNVGLRRVGTKYVMTSDADIILSPHYLHDAISVLLERPMSVVCSAMLDLPEESVEVTRHAAERQRDLDPLQWRQQCPPRLGWELHPSVGVTLTAFHHAIRGYDEFYEGWGREDEDLMRRFRKLGLQLVAAPERSFYLHQWHPKFEGIADDERERSLERNAQYFLRNHSILRNDEGWGEHRGGEC